MSIGGDRESVGGDGVSVDGDRMIVIVDRMELDDLVLMVTRRGWMMTG